MNKNSAINFGFFLLLLFISPFVIISFFNQPCMDDFWSADIINHYGRLGEVKYFAENINGRFFSNTIMGLLNPLPQHKMWLFNIGPVVIIILLFCSFFFFYKSVFYKAENKSIGLLSLLFLVLHIINMRSLFEGLYWTFASLSYQVSIMLFLIAAGSLIRYYKTNSVYYLVIAICCSFILPGSVESIAPLYFIFLCIIYSLCIKFKKPFKPIMFCFLAHLAGIAVVLASSGNYSRISYNSIAYKSNILLALFYAVRSAGYYCCIWFINPANVLALLLLIPYIYHLSKRLNKNLPSFIKKINPLTFLIAASCICLTVYFPEHYFESAIPYPRITTIFLFAFIHVVLITDFLFFIRIKNNRRIISFISYVKKYQVYIAAFFFISIFCSKNFSNVLHDLLSGIAYNYNKEAKQRFEFLQNCASDTCYVSYYKNWPSSIQSFQREGMNTTPFIHMDKYFGKTILYKGENNFLK